ncbi:signal recognition particle-docking protein FtsY [Kistimonas scapharcae]|uniref:Signal recognition particle receptor FtsY n=1 Tax=Kistimonas scapharcae TaxID=1036133 RepID=A0ABP8UZL4_9GAMM
MFGKKDEKGAEKRRFWPWGKKDETVAPQPAAENQLETEKPVAPQSAISEENQPPVAESVEKREPTVGLKPESPAERVVADKTPDVAGVSPKAAAPEVPQVPVSAAPNVPQASVQTAVPAEQAVMPEPVAQPAAEPEQTEGGFFSRMKKGLTKTRASLVEGVATLFIGKKEIDDELMEDLETELVMADVGVEATRDIMAGLTERVKYKELDDADALMAALKVELAKILEPADKPLLIDQSRQPYVILVVGVNGVGKTTTIGKLAKRLQKEGRKVMLAAGDTFRAAAVEQLQVWGERNQIPVIAQHTGADSASVIYDAFEAAKARGADVLIADTAGRLHNKEHLMEELKKVKRVLGKLDETAPHEVLLVMDAGTGQNALSQAKLFNDTVQVTGMALTKLDGTAKGGVVFALARQMQLPIRFLGVGEQIDDLRPFKAAEFVDALFADTEFQ